MDSTDPHPSTRRWRRTSFRRFDGSTEFAPDDWCLTDDRGQPLARLYRQNGGPQGGRWLWFVQVDPQGRPWNGGAGTAATGREAREAVEALVPVGVQMRRPVRAGQGGALDP
jgi:hypothetical protein